MKARTLHCISLAVALLLAGCVQSGDPPASSSDGRPAGGEPPKGGGAGESVHSDSGTKTSQAFSLNGCLAFTAGIPLVAEVYDQDDRVPWPQQRDTYYYFLEAYECQRVGWGSFERGPIKFVLESETVGGWPQGCVPDQQNYVRYLHAIYSDDEQFGRALAQAMGVTFYNATFAIDSGSVTPPRTASLELQPAGYPETVIHAMPADEPQRALEWNRMFITQSQNGTSRLDLTGESKPLPILEDAGYGWFEEPTVLEPHPAQPVPGTPAMDAELQASGQLIHWSDPKCT